MERRDVFMLILLLIAAVAGIVGGCVWLVLNLEPLAHLLLLFFLIAAG